jgi:hypothetical protein
MLAHSRRLLAPRAPSRERIRRVGTRRCQLQTLATLGALGWFAAALAPPPLWAAPSLRVRAQVGIELQAVPSANGISVRGEIRDDLGAALPGRELQLRIEPGAAAGRTQSRTLHSDGRGRFVSNLGALTNAQISVDYDGDNYYQRASATRTIEPQRSEVQLEFSEPSQLALSLDQANHSVVLRALSPLGGAGLAISLQDELARPLASGVTDATGTLRLDPSSALLGEPGLGELVATTAGDETRAAARGVKALLRTRATQVEISANFAQERALLHLHVRLHTQAGPLAGRAVGVFIDDAHLATLLTDAHGQATRTLPAQRLQPGRHSLVARFEGDTPGLLASRSEPLALAIAPHLGPSTLWLLLPALASLGFVLWSLRRGAQPMRDALPSPASAPEVQLGALLRERGAQVFSIEGHVIDGESGIALAALIALLDPIGHELRLEADGGGHFASPDLAAAEYRVLVWMAGYAPARFHVRIPHAGTGSGVRVALRNLRGLALDAYAALAERVFASEATSSMATVRETLAAAASGAPSLQQVSMRVEELAYARTMPTEDDLDALQREIDAAIADRSASSQPEAAPTLEQ